MRKKFTMLLASLLCCVGVVRAAVTDLPQMSTEGDIKWYTIKNVRQQKYATYAGDAETMTQQANASAASFFYFTASSTEGAVKIHNYAAGEQLCAAYNSWTATGIDWYLAAQETGVSICTSTGEWDAWNDAGGGGQKIEYWSASDAGSAWEISLVTDFSAVIDIAALKTAAIAEINNYAVETTIYPAATEAAVGAVNAVTPVSNGLKDLNDAAEAINAIVVDYRNAAYKALEGKYYTIKTPARGNGYMQMATSKVIGTAEVASPANIWQFVCNDDGTLKVYNPYTGKYLCEPQGSSTDVAVTTESSAAGAYILNVNNTDAENTDAKVKFTSNGKSVHMAGGSNLVRWDNGGASEWQVAEITDFSSIIDLYKAAAIASMGEWKTLSVVFDAALIDAAEKAISGINTTDWATFAAIDAELTKVTDAVAAKMFTFQTIATDNHRENVWVSANMTTGKAIGLPGEHNYNSIWSLRHAGGVAFYLYNELNSVYMGAPSANCPLTESPTAAYTFEIIDAKNSVVEMHVGEETLHASNHADDKLLNYDGDEDASRWTIRTIDVAADIQTLLNGLTKGDYADVPALGQYPTVAYEALVAARTSSKTVEEVEAAIATFKASKNLPVFTISGTKDYVVGKSIYDNNSGTLHFKATDRCDKTMWWALDQTATTVGVTEEVGIYNVGTGNGFWGASSIKISETNENDGAGIADDGIFLFYTIGNNTPIHFQSTDSKIVRWGSYEANSGSAATFTYIGNTYDLNKLTEEHLSAFAALQDLYDSKKFYNDVVVGNAIGEYTGDKAPVVAALKSLQDLLSVSLKDLVNMSLEDLDLANATKMIDDAAKSMKKNLPVAGKYYRFRSALAGFPVIKAVYGDFDENGDPIVRWKTFDEGSMEFYWKAVETSTGGIALQNVKNSKYLVGNETKSGAWSMADASTGAEIDVTILGKNETTGKYEYGVIVTGWQMHVLNHQSGAGTDGGIVSYPGEANSPSAWYIEELELPSFFDITYHFTYEGKVKHSVTKQVGAGAEYSDPSTYWEKLPYGIKIVGEKPAGKAEGKAEFNIALEIEKALPFKAAADVASINTWYYAQMHANSAVTSYIQDNEAGNVEWADRFVTEDEIDSHLWGFAGDVWTGIKVVNKATGKAIVSTKGDAAMGDAANATAFIPTNSQANGNWFCLKYPEDANYLNAQSGKVGSYGDNDNGSSFLLTEYKEGAVVEVSDIEYATLYLDYAAYIPEGVEVYVVEKAANGYATLKLVENDANAIPANTGVILKNAGKYTLKAAGAGSVANVNSLLKGSVTDTYVAGGAYVLAEGSKGVGLYKAQLNKNEAGAAGETHFLNNAGKAYLPASAVADASAPMFSFDRGEGTTDIIDVEPAMENVVIYDLTGRRVEKMEKGIYIVNGRKVYVK